MGSGWTAMWGASVEITVRGGRGLLGLLPVLLMSVYAAMATTGTTTARPAYSTATVCSIAVASTPKPAIANATPNTPTLPPCNNAS